MPYASLACDMTSASEVAVAAWGALQVLYAFAFPLPLVRHFAQPCPQNKAERNQHTLLGSHQLQDQRSSGNNSRPSRQKVTVANKHRRLIDLCISHSQTGLHHTLLLSTLLKINMQKNTDFNITWQVTANAFYQISLHKGKLLKSSVPPKSTHNVSFTNPF